MLTRKREYRNSYNECVRSDRAHVFDNRIVIVSLGLNTLLTQSSTHNPSGFPCPKDTDDVGPDRRTHNNNNTTTMTMRPPLTMDARTLSAAVSDVWQTRICQTKEGLGRVWSSESLAQTLTCVCGWMESYLTRHDYQVTL